MAYAHTTGHAEMEIQVVASSPDEFTALLRDVRRAGVHRFAVDYCPHCRVATAIDSAGVRTAKRVIDIWVIHSASRIVRFEHFITAAGQALAEGDTCKARDIALEVVKHVDVDHPAVHLFLGRCALRLGDDRLFREARDFVALFGPDWIGRFDALTP
jgi:hypothetical protein